jgi:hypothetical protein
LGFFLSAGMGLRSRSAACAATYKGRRAELS